MIVYAHSLHTYVACDTLLPPHRECLLPAGDNCTSFVAFFFHGDGGDDDARDDDDDDDVPSGCSLSF